MRRLDLLTPGQEVGRYQVLDVLGQGGMAVVYRVRHTQLGSLHALKVTAVPSRSVLVRLMREGSAQARIRHRNIVAVHDVIEVDGSPGLIMEYVDGPSLEELLDRGPLSLEQVDRVGRGLLRGVAAAHAEGLVHRDLKPANVLVAIEDDGWIPKVADFGLVKDVAATSHTRTGSLMGTPHYMSPEQIRDAGSVDARSDVFALGAILYELLTGRRAFDGTDVLDIFNRVASGRYAPIDPIREGVPARMSRTVARALAVAADDRFESVEGMLKEWCGEVTDAAIAPTADTLARERGVSRRPPPAANPTLAATFDVDAATESVPTPLTAPTLEPAPARSWRMVVGLAAGVAMLAALPLLAGGIAAGAWSLGLYPEPPPRGEDAEPVSPAPAPEPAPREPDPEPTAAPPEPEPAPPPVPAPIAQAPRPTAAPAPAPAVEAPAPAPPPPPEPVAEPTAEPPLPGGVVIVTGDLDNVLLRPVAGGDALRQGRVPEGVYDVVARIDAPEPTTLARITVGTATVRVQCSALLKRCTVQ